MEKHTSLSGICTARLPGARALATLRPMSVPTPLRVFLSYTHENSAHQARVRRLAQRFVEEGFEVTFDLDWPAPTEGWPLWTERELIAADVVLLIITPAYRQAFELLQTRWPGPAVGRDLFEAQSAHRTFIPVVFSEADRAARPPQLTHLTCYSVETEMDLSLLFRILAGFVHSVEPAVDDEPAQDVPAANAPRLTSPLPTLDRHLATVQARLSFHRRAWRFFRSGVEALGIALEEEVLDENGSQKITGPGLVISLTQHSEHTEARLEIQPQIAPIYANLLGVVSGARQPVECTYLMFILRPEWKLAGGAATIAPLLTGTDLTWHGTQGLEVHGWRFVIPALSAPDPRTVQIKIVPRPAYPWPLNPLRLLLYHLEKRGAIFQ